MHGAVCGCAGALHELLGHVLALQDVGRFGGMMHLTQAGRWAGITNVLHCSGALCQRQLDVLCGCFTTDIYSGSHGPKLQ